MNWIVTAKYSNILKRRFALKRCKNIIIESGTRYSTYLELIDISLNFPVAKPQNRNSNKKNNINIIIGRILKNTLTRSINNMQYVDTGPIPGIKFN